MVHLALCFLILCSFFIKAEEFKYFSEGGQDKFFHKMFFKNKRDGFFVDIGASDGTTFSNTCFFERSLGWKGICIEPAPDAFELLCQRRRNSICIEGCIADYTGRGTYADGGLLGGLVDKLDPRFKYTPIIKCGILQGKVKTLEVSCYVLSDILDRYNVRHIDFLSIDVEGAEFDILKTIDFQKCAIDCITVEINIDGDTKIRAFLEDRGFVFLKKKRVDEFYARKLFLLQNRHLFDRN